MSSKRKIRFREVSILVFRYKKKTKEDHSKNYLLWLPSFRFHQLHQPNLVHPEKLITQNKSKVPISISGWQILVNAYPYVCETF